MPIKAHPIRTLHMHQLARNGAVHNREIDYHEWLSRIHRQWRWGSLEKRNSAARRKGGIAIEEPDSIERRKTAVMFQQSRERLAFRCDTCDFFVNVSSAEFPHRRQSVTFRGEFKVSRDTHGDVKKRRSEIFQRRHPLFLVGERATFVREIMTRRRYCLPRWCRRCAITLEVVWECTSPDNNAKNRERNPIDWCIFSNVVTVRLRKDILFARIAIGLPPSFALSCRISR